MRLAVPGAAALLALGLEAGTASAATYTHAVIAGTTPSRRVLSARDAKMDSQLRRLIAPETTPGGPSPTFAPRAGAWRHGDVVRIQAVLGAGIEPSVLAPHGLTVERVVGEVVEGTITLGALAGLADLDVVRALRPARPGRLRATTVDAATRADLARATGVDGSGVVVGVVSDGRGTLPGSVVPSGCDPGSGSEGQAIIDIVQTLAPGATLRFASGITSDLGFIDAVQCLGTAGARVIVDDLGFFDQPFFEDGSIAQAVRAAVQAGISYHSAAGNDATTHYGASFVATSGSQLHNFATAGSADNYDEIDVGPGDELDCVLQWNDPFGGAADDYDLAVYDMGTSPPTLVATSANAQTGTQDPYEDFSIVNVGSSTGRAGVAIEKVNGAALVLGLFCFGGSVPEYVTPSGSIVGHPALAEVVAVGAVDVNDVGLDAVESYSSQGPVSIYFPSSETRAKPDLVGFDGIPTTTPGFAAFYGTSAAAPDAAAVAALMLEKNGCRTPAQIRQALVASAVDIGVAGVDSVAGAGRLDALGAVDAVPPPTCAADTECDDGDTCTTDKCEGCSCEHRSACDDGDSCTTDACDRMTGCTSTPIEGFDGVGCVCGKDLTYGCTGVTLPRAIRRQFDRGCQLVARAAHTAKVPRRRRLIHQGIVAFQRARRRTSVAQRRSTLGATCAGLVAVVVDDARSRTEQLADGL